MTYLQLTHTFPEREVEPKEDRGCIRRPFCTFLKASLYFWEINFMTVSTTISSNLSFFQNIEVSPYQPFVHSSVQTEERILSWMLVNQKYIFYFIHCLVFIYFRGFLIVLLPVKHSIYLLMIEEPLWFMHTIYKFQHTRLPVQSINIFRPFPEGC